MKDVDVRQRQGFLRPPRLSWRKPRHRQSPSQHGVAGSSAFPPWDILPLPAPPRWHHGPPLLRRAAGRAPRGVPRASSALPFYTALAAPRCCWLRIHQEKEGNNEVESVKRGANAGAMMSQLEGARGVHRVLCHGHPAAVPSAPGCSRGICKCTPGSEAQGQELLPCSLPPRRRSRRQHNASPRRSKVAVH